MKKGEPVPDIFDSQNDFNRRRKLLPLWIKVFIWFFLILGIIASLILSFGAFLDDTDLSLYGLSTTHPYSATGIIICWLFILKGIVAYSLWFEYRWAPKAAITDVILGLIICIAVMVRPLILPSYPFTFRMELIPLCFYLIDMVKIEKRWERLK